MRRSMDEAALNKKKAYLLSVGYRDTPNSCKVKQEITESGVKSNTSFVLKTQCLMSVKGFIQTG